MFLFITKVQKNFKKLGLFKSTMIVLTDHISNVSSTYIHKYSFLNHWLIEQITFKICAFEIGKIPKKLMQTINPKGMKKTLLNLVESI